LSGSIGYPNIENVERFLEQSIVPNATNKEVYNLRRLFMECIGELQITMDYKEKQERYNGAT